MAWNDGLSKMMGDFLDSLGDLGTVARETAEGVIDTEAEGFRKNVEPRIPVDTGGLKNSFTFEKQTDAGSDWYGYRAGFDGNTPRGEPYEKIANIQNYGNAHLAGTHFVTKAIKKLKGMDGRIEARIEAELSKRT